ncbi:FAD:protein FMN transferase [Phytohalomonas tamaricis]|uniref:FAD:protein FMN transferase n=1 Tax=Phytohalomonas tamaricis TaxID=2081032 RepID=UPI000D0B033A|nr:FAD:protein FMN transferase [Phytohalomonas tamaricis]
MRQLSFTYRSITLLGAALVATLLTACERTPELYKAQGEAQGTSYHITYWRDGDVDEQAIAADVITTFKQIDKAISTYRDDSWLAEFNHNHSTDWQQAPPEVIELLGIAATVHQQSNGCYDPTIAPLFSLWGFHDHNFHVPNADVIATILAHVGLEHVQVDAEHQRIRKDLPELSIDLSSLGEGYTIRRLSEQLEARGVTDYLVELGGDMKVRGHKPGGEKWRVGIESPVPDRIEAQKIVTIEDESGVSLNTSGSYRRYFDDNGNIYSHIIDARTGRPTTHTLVSASVFGVDPAVSDAWATAMLCLGEQEGLKVARAQQLPIYFIEKQDDDFKITLSPALETSTRIGFEH